MSQPRFKDIKITAGGGFEGQEYSPGLGRPTDVTVVVDGVSVVHTLSGEGSYGRFSASFPLFLIREAWGLGCSFEEEADGYGKGRGTHGDWSGIRDSSDGAVAEMLTKALNFIFLPRRL